MEDLSRLSTEELKKMKPLDVLEDVRVKARFVGLYNRTHRSEHGEIFYEREKFNFQRIMGENADLRACTAFSVYGVFLDIATMGITIEKTSQPLAYITFFNVKASTNPDVWEKRAVIDVSPYGELALRIQCGQILYADRPVVVYDGDVFKPMVNDRGHKIVRYECAIPRASKKIIGSFIGLTRPDHSRDFYWMLPDDIERLSKYSAKKNKTAGANALYTSDGGQIDPGFLEAKTIKHAFKTFPKVKIGQFSQLQVAEEDIQATDYGLDEPVAQPQRPELPKEEVFEAEVQTAIPEAGTVAVEDKSNVF